MSIYNPITIWLTGLPSSGKTTLGEALKSKLKAIDVNSILLDGDEVRKSICADLGFSEKDRAENIRRVASIARLLNSQGFMVVCCFVSPLISMRSMAREIVGVDNFYEVFVDADVATCSMRDVKGLYKKASKGMINDLTGISAPYEKPLNPDLHINTQSLSEDLSVELLYTNALSWIKLQ
ncbi:MAG: adenylyl-sulfate kinase [Bacteroidales bacterium]